MSEAEAERPPEAGEITGRDGLMLIRVGNRQYPAKQVAQCRTCRSKYRAQIEQGIIGGMPYQMIYDEMIEPHEDHSPIGPPSVQSLMTHVRRKHMPVPFSVQRRIIEQRATELGRSVEEGEQLLVDSVAVHRTVIQRGFEMLNAGEIAPSMNDLMKALQLQAAVDSDKNSGGVDEEVWREGLIAYMEIVQRNVSAEVFQRIGHEMAQSPVLQELAMRRRQTVMGQVES